MLVDVRGNGSTVLRQFPSSGTLPKGSTIILYTEEGLEDSTVVVPNLTGRSVASVEQTLSALGLNLRKEGNISSDNVVATAQDIESGSTVTVGSVITVTFHDPNATVE